MGVMSAATVGKVLRNAKACFATLRRRPRPDPVTLGLVTVGIVTQIEGWEDVITQTAREGPMGRFQVLSLDGGGIRGIFSAALLAGLEKDLGRPVVDHFDLVVGTSTGGVIAAALGAGITAQDVVGMYVSNMDRIFPGPRRL